MSQDYQTRQLNIEKGNLTGPIRTCHNAHTHTGNTRQPEPQLKSSLCSSAIPSDNSRDTFWATTQGTPASWPSKNHQRLVDHAYQNKQNTFASPISPDTTHELLGATCFSDRLTGDVCRQAPLHTLPLQVSPGSTTFTRGATHSCCPLKLSLLLNSSNTGARRHTSTRVVLVLVWVQVQFVHTLTHIVNQPIQLSYLCSIRVPTIHYHHHNYYIRIFQSKSYH